MRRAKFIEAREGKHLSQADLAEILECSEDSVSRWERGTSYPGPYARRQMQAFFGVEDLDAFLQLTSDEEDDPTSKVILTLVLPNSLQSFFSGNITMRLLNIAHTDYSTSDEMTNALQTAIKEFDTMNLDPLTRREALMSLASLPAMTLGQKQTLKTAHSEEMLRHCTAALEACWELYRGSDPVGTQHAFDCVCTYKPLLEVIARDSSQLRKQALDLATRYAILQTMMGWSCAKASATVGYAQNALTLSEETGDIFLQLSAYSKLGYAYITDRKYPKAHEIILKGESVLKRYQRNKRQGTLPSGIIGSFNSSYALIQADNGMQPDRALGIATDSEPLKGHMAFIEFTSSVQWLEAARTCCSHGDSIQAMIWIGKRIDPKTLTPRPNVPQSERGRIIAINVMTRALLQSKERDMEEIIRIWQAAMTGAHALRSERIYDKAMTNFEIMYTLWPSEDAIKKLVPLTSHW